MGTMYVVPSLTEKLHKYYFGNETPQKFAPRAQLAVNQIHDLERLHDAIVANPGAPIRELETVKLPNIGLKYGLTILMAVKAVTRQRLGGKGNGYGYWAVIA